jgi:hypothetical protein
MNPEMLMYSFLGICIIAGVGAIYFAHKHAPKAKSTKDKKEV